MAVKIDKKIKGYAVVTPEDKAKEAAKVESVQRATIEAQLPMADVIQMHEKIERPEVLIGSTYKIKTPVSDHAMYVTINDIVLNEGTEYEQRRPFEVFINSKNLDHFQWIVALTRIISAVFRKGGDVTFLVDELKAVFDPRGGYWQPGGKFMPSIVAEIGYVVERHLQTIGLMQKPGMDDSQRLLVESKRKEWELRNKQQDAFAQSSYPEGAQLCVKCNTAALVMMDGCMKEHGTHYVPTISAGKFVYDKAQDPDYFPAIVRPKALEVGPQIQQTFAKAWKAGVTIMFGTDTGVGPHGSNGREFGYMVEAGMPVMDAIRSATMVPAKYLGIDDKLGSLAAGKIADIVAVPGDPIADVHTLEHVSFVMKEGVIYKR